MDLISIIIPVYNGEKFIEKCINSILNQDYENIEIIAVDDGSKDSSLEIMQKIANTDNRLKIFSKENGGVSSTRNFGIEKANGAYISFVDSDDFLPKNALSSLSNHISNDVDLISGSYIKISYKKEYMTHSSRTVDHDQKYDDFLNYEHTNWGPWGKLYKKSIIDENNIRFPEGISYGEDHIFNLRYVKHTKNDLVISNDYVYCYNNRLRDNLCSRAFENMALAELTLFEAVLDFFENKEISNDVYNSYLLGTINGSLEHYCVYFNNSKRIKLIEHTFDIFNKYITKEFISSNFSEIQIENIKAKDFKKFEIQYTKENKQIVKRRIKKHIKNILQKFI